MPISFTFPDPVTFSSYHMKAVSTSEHSIINQATIYYEISIYYLQVRAMLAQSLQYAVVAAFSMDKDSQIPTTFEVRNEIHCLFGRTSANQPHD